MIPEFSQLGINVDSSHAMLSKSLFGPLGP
jgi:hypothetical protein